MDTQTLAPRLYRARQRAFGIDSVLWGSLQDCERERWRRIAARLTITPATTGKDLFEAWAVDLYPAPWEDQSHRYRVCWREMAGYLKYELRPEAEAA